MNLNEYAKELYSCRHETVELKCAEVSHEDWLPKPKDCHVNATQWCCIEPKHKAVRGWLFFDLYRIDEVLFVAHSVIETPRESYVTLLRQIQLRGLRS